MNYCISLEMAERLTVSNVLRLVMSDGDSDDSENIHDGSDEDFGLLEDDEDESNGDLENNEMWGLIKKWWRMETMKRWWMKR